jgi:hypothetical protein
LCGEEENVFLVKGGGGEERREGFSSGFPKINSTDIDRQFRSPMLKIYDVNKYF